MGVLGDVRDAARFALGHWRLRRPKAKGRPSSDQDTSDAIEAALVAEGITVTPLRIDVADYHGYLSRADYSRHSGYYAWNSLAFAEKSLEHYLALLLLAPRPGSVYIDVASDTSPTAEIYARLFGVESYRQDLSFPAGVNGDMIGGDASSMPVSPGFADSIALHCSFEHFEGGSDGRFVKECARLLRPGGRVCILPLYLHTHHAVLTDTTRFRWSDRPSFDPDATIYNVAGWGHRHGRLYSARNFNARVMASRGGMRATIYRITNPHEIAPTCYLTFALVLEQPR